MERIGFRPLRCFIFYLYVARTARENSKTYNIIRTRLFGFLNCVLENNFFENILFFFLYVRHEGD